MAGRQLVVRLVPAATHSTYAAASPALKAGNLFTHAGPKLPQAPISVRPLVTSAKCLVEERPNLQP